MYKIKFQNNYQETFTTKNFCRASKYIREILEKDFKILSQNIEFVAINRVCEIFNHYAIQFINLMNLTPEMLENDFVQFSTFQGDIFTISQM